MSKQISIEFDDFFQPEKPAEELQQKNVAELKEELTRRSGGGRRKLDAPVSDEVVLPPDEELFKKTYYRIGEVSAMLHEQTSLIRYWTNEFKISNLRKNRKGDRYFRPQDVKTLYLIHHLLRVRKFTIEGAREFLKDEKAAMAKFETIESLEKLKLFLQQLKDNL